MVDVNELCFINHGAQAPRAENTRGAYGAKSAYGATAGTPSPTAHARFS